MRVFLNGRDIGALDQNLERRLQGRPSDRVVETIAWSEMDSIRAKNRELLQLLFGIAGLVMLIFGVNLVIVALRAPAVFVIVAVAFGAAAGFTAGVISLVYVLTLGAHRRRVEARAALPQLPPGTTVRLGGDGLTVDGRLRAWSSLAIDEVRIRRQQGSESPITYVERLVLSDGVRATPLDAAFLANGRTVLRQAWLRLRAAGR